MKSRITIEKLDYICEVHVVVQNNVTVVLHKCQSNKQDKVAWADMLGCPNCLPNGENIWVQEFWIHEKQHINEGITNYKLEHFKKPLENIPPPLQFTKRKI